MSYSAFGAISTNLITMPTANQYVEFGASVTNNNGLGGNLTFNVPTGISFLPSTGSQSSLVLAKGQYLISLSAANALSGGNNSPQGSYADIGLSKNQTNFAVDRRNLGGFVSSYTCFQLCTTPAASAGTSDSYTAFCAVGGGANYNSATTNVQVRILKLG